MNSAFIKSSSIHEALGIRCQQKQILWSLIRKFKVTFSYLNVFVLSVNRVEEKK